MRRTSDSIARETPEEVYSPDEIARAAGLAETAVINAIGDRRALVRYSDAIHIARQLRAGHPFDRPLLSIAGSPMPERTRGVFAAVSGSIHLLAFGVIALIATLGMIPVSTLASQPPSDPIRLVYLAIPGPGGGGGGGGRREKLAPPKALRKGNDRIGSPLPIEEPPVTLEPTKAPEPLKSDELPAIIAPIAPAAPDVVDRGGLLKDTRAAAESGGPGTASGIGQGTGSGLGEGNGAGIGPGSGGGTGGGPYRPGSGVTPPRLVQEVKPTYPEDARKRSIEGMVDLEIVVRRDGTVGDVKILKGLAADFNDRAVQAVRRWRFEPGRLKGTPVDVLVEVSVEFRMR